MHGISTLESRLTVDDHLACRQEAMFAQEELRRNIEEVKYRAMAEQQRSGDTSKNLFRFVQSPDRYLATPGKSS